MITDLRPAAAVRHLPIGIVVLAVTLLTMAPSAGAAPTTVATASGQSCAVMSGVVRCWGGNSTGALGFQTAESSVPYATPVGVKLRGVTDIVGTSTGSGSSGRFCAAASGAAWCGGRTPTERSASTPRSHPPSRPRCPRSQAV